MEGRRGAGSKGGEMGSIWAAGEFVIIHREIVAVKLQWETDGDSGLETRLTERVAMCSEECIDGEVGNEWL